MDNRDSEQTERQSSQQSNYFQVRPELAGSLRSGRLRPDLTEQQVSGVNSPLNSGPADCQNISNELRLTACQNISDELGLVTGIIEAPSEQQVEDQAYNIINQATDQSVIECEERRMSGPGDGTVGQQVTSPTRRMPGPGDVTSPTAYSEDNMPRTVEASRFK